jgi:hypothetical protein
MGSHAAISGGVLGEDFRIQIEDLDSAVGVRDMGGRVVGSARMCVGHVHYAMTPCVNSR